MLEKSVVRLGPDLKSQEGFKARFSCHLSDHRAKHFVCLSCQVSSGSLVMVKDINNVEVAGGWQVSQAEVLSGSVEIWSEKGVPWLSSMWRTVPSEAERDGPQAEKEPLPDLSWTLTCH